MTRLKGFFKSVLLLLFLLVLFVLSFVFTDKETPEAPKNNTEETIAIDSVGNEFPINLNTENIDFSLIPDYSGEMVYLINNGKSNFREDEKTTTAFEFYSDLDNLGRVGIVEACIGKELMPTEERGDISSIKPTGWKQNYYEFVDQEALYNRCHMVGFQLSGENANENNLMTGTRSFNVLGMLPYETQIASYVRKTGNHVIYRVTPDFRGDNLLANGVQLEAYSVEDNGAGVDFNVYCYNVEPGVTIDYATGENYANETKNNSEGEIRDFVLNKNSKVYHDINCPAVLNMNSENKIYFSGSINDIPSDYRPHNKCVN